jgi:hypothetical protein
VQSSAISFMNEILVASSALAAYFTISALFGDMRWMRFRWRLNGAYNRSISRKAASSSVPTTMRSGFRKSSIAAPSFKNSGLLTTLIFFFAEATTAETRSFVPTGTVLFKTSSRSCSAACPTLRATSITRLRSAEPSSLGGVPTATNTT